MKLVSKITLLVLGVTLVAATCLFFPKNTFDARRMFARADTYLISLQMKNGVSAKISKYLDQKAGVCSLSGGFSLVAQEGQNFDIGVLEVFPFNLPLTRGHTVTEAIVCEGKSGGPKLNLNPIAKTIFLIERMIDQPFLLRIRGEGSLLVSGQNMNFIWSSEFGDVQVRALGPGRVELSAIEASNFLKLRISTVQGTIAAEKLGSVGAGYDGEQALELSANEGSKLIWEKEKTPVTPKAPGVVLPSGFRFR